MKKTKKASAQYLAERVEVFDDSGELADELRGIAEGLDDDGRYEDAYYLLESAVSLEAMYHDLKRWRRLAMALQPAETLTLEEAAELMKLDVADLNALVAAGEVPAACLVSRDAVIDFLSAKGHEQAAERRTAHRVAP